MKSKKIDLHKCRILLIEDQYSESMIITEALREKINGAAVTRLRTESEFYDHFDELAESPPHLIIIDMLLPWTSSDRKSDLMPKDLNFREAGVRIQQRLSSDLRTCNLPILVCSHVSPDEIKQKFGAPSGNVTIYPDKDPAKLASLAASILSAAAVLSDEPENSVDSSNRLFISYARKDRIWVDRLKVFLKPFENRIFFWDDSKLQDGKWQEQLEEEMRSCSAALFLVSPDFCASDFIGKIELPTLLRARFKGVHILWISVRPASFDWTPLGEFQCLNDPANPLSGLPLPKREKKMKMIAERIVELMG